MGFQEMEMKTEIVENWKPSFNDENRPTRADLNESENPRSRFVCRNLNYNFVNRTEA